MITRPLLLLCLVFVAGCSLAMPPSASPDAGIVPRSVPAGLYRGCAVFAPNDYYSAVVSSTVNSSYELPYGARLRLRASFSTAGWGPQATMVANAMTRYGIYLADTGSDSTGCTLRMRTMEPILGIRWI